MHYWNTVGKLWAKCQDTFLPLGPCLVPRDGLAPGGLMLTCQVNGEVRQRASTAKMIFSVADVVAHASRHVTLEPGDLLLCGTPEGITPLQDGDTVAVEIPEIGTLRNPVEEAPGGGA